MIGAKVAIVDSPDRSLPAVGNTDDDLVYLDVVERHIRRRVWRSGWQTAPRHRSRCSARTPPGPARRASSPHSPTNHAAGAGGTAGAPATPLRHPAGSAQLRRPAQARTTARQAIDHVRRGGRRRGDGDGSGPRRGSDVRYWGTAEVRAQHRAADGRPFAPGPGHRSVGRCASPLRTLVGVPGVAGVVEDAGICCCHRRASPTAN
jgi:hypothetical protein